MHSDLPVSPMIKQPPPSAHPNRSDRSPPYSGPLIVLALQIVFISALFSYYHVQIPFGSSLSWIRDRISQVPMINTVIHNLEHTFHTYFPKSGSATVERRHNTPKQRANAKKGDNVKAASKATEFPVFSTEQLALHDGSDPSKPVYLAILGRVFDVDKGRKHYGKGGGYHFFAGKDASRAFVTGDFSAEGLNANVNELSQNELLSINDWLKFYEREYPMVGLLAGPYYDGHGEPTELLEQVNANIEKAKDWKDSQAKAQQIFPPCNSEWKKGMGGRVWCTSKSGGVTREWVGVPRKLYTPGSDQYKCVCVKNFGDPLASSPSSGSGQKRGRGDLDHSALAEYDQCPPDSNSCRIPPS